ncbi:cell wall-binding repeat protein [Lachnoanaerobaculum saburreum F0468]|uniref:Cell wall-binding repeat protein n=1 Tax=Lachnoanaerobaculum saburreum F0468 TaxID=1095750 RepID=I0RA13_9FIRM|nr:cell wall-binding protein [Lachnoanaerobaculum saburreum]EIC96521.1 cell wall-binding repeat protein [Lachnoanaerobaculum saburreum F0468]
MRSSLKISNRIDMSGKKVVFNTKETANKAPVKRVVNRKFNMNKMAKNALGSIPSCVFVNGSLEQRMGMEFLKMGQGSIPTVTGSLIKTELNKSGEKTMGIKDINHVLYHDTTGVRTVAKAASKSGNDVSSDIKKAERNGWVKTEMGWMYNESGKPVTGWKQIDGKWYYFEANGVMQTGWKQVSGKWYYLHTDGAMRTGWKQIGGKWYYFHTDGAMRTDWKQIGDKWYYLHEDGHMAKSEKIQGEDGRVYVIDENGVFKYEYSGIDINQFIDLAKKEKGTYEIGKNNVKYNTWFYGEEVEDCYKNGKFVSYAWCSVFILWVGNEAGLLDGNNMPTFSEARKGYMEGQKELSKWYEKKGRLHKLSDNGQEEYKPRSGDIGFFKHSHVGIVVAYDQSKKYVYTIEGNADEAVRFQRRSILEFRGFGSNGGTDYGQIPEDSELNPGISGKTR